MGKSGELFANMRNGEGISFAQNFTKKEAIATGTKMVEDFLEAGEGDKMELAANLLRLEAVIGAAVVRMRKDLPTEKTTMYGIEYQYSEGGNKLQYQEDPVWAELSKQLKAREDLLKAALKSTEPLFTEEGEVPRVSTKPIASSVKITF